MRKKWIVLIVVSVLLMLILRSCSPIKKDDDSANWGRAFNGQTPPPGVVVMHSRYYRLPHFLYEGYYYFMIVAPEPFLDSWVKSGRMAPEVPTSADLGSMYDRPAWFLPWALGTYEMWRPYDDRNSNFRIFRDRFSKEVFVTDSN